MTDKLGQQTIRDFGRQHRSYSESGGYYVSTDILADVVGPLMDIGAFEGRDVLDIGSGTGRWLRVFHQLGARSITAVEPSPAIEVSKNNTADPTYLVQVLCLSRSAVVCLDETCVIPLSQAFKTLSQQLSRDAEPPRQSGRGQ